MHLIFSMDRRSARKCIQAGIGMDDESYPKLSLHSRARPQMKEGDAPGCNTTSPRCVKLESIGGIYSTYPMGKPWKLRRPQRTPQ